MSAGAPAEGPGANEPRYLGAIDLGARLGVAYFAIVATAIAVDMAFPDAGTFRTWRGFTIQALGALSLGTLAIRGPVARLHPAGRLALPVSAGVAAIALGAVLAAGTLAGGLFPDSPTYQRRAPQPFVRTLLALLPALGAGYAVLRREAVEERPAQSSHEPPLSGARREAAQAALDALDRFETALTAFHDRASVAQGASPDVDRLWAALDGYDSRAGLRH